MSDTPHYINHRKRLRERFQKTGADGMPVPFTGVISTVDMNAGTKSATNADSKFLLINTTKGSSSPFTWSKGDQTDQATVNLSVTRNDRLAINQVIEDGTTEFADATFSVLVP